MYLSIGMVWQKTQFATWMWRKKPQNTHRRLTVTKYIFAHRHANNNSNKIHQSMDIRTKPKISNNSIRFLFRVCPHTFFLLILSFPGIFHHSLTCMNCSKRTARCLQTLKPWDCHKRDPQKSHKILIARPFVILFFMLPISFSKTWAPPIVPKAIDWSAQLCKQHGKGSKKS